MRPQEAICDNSQEQAYPTSYREVEIRGTLFRVTSVYKGEIQLKDALEELAVKRVLREALSESGSL